MHHFCYEQSAVHRTSQSRDRPLILKEEIKSAVCERLLLPYRLSFLTQVAHLLPSNYAHIALHPVGPLDLSLLYHRNRFGYHI